MSRVGKKPIPISDKHEVDISEQTVTIKGPKGELTKTLNPAVDISVEDNPEGDGEAIIVSVERPSNPYMRSQWGTARSVLEGMVIGVTDGFSKQLEINGVGYSAQVSGSTLKLSVGLSHDVDFDLPEGISAEVEDNKITISGTDKQLVGQTAAQIRSVRKPEPYKGKGIKYVDEVIRRKVGKAAQAVE
jgi:large subunit ribosomal protein L6